MNNHDPFKKNWTQLEGDDADLVRNAKEAAENLLRYFEKAALLREISIAKTKLEEAMMWFTKGYILQVDARKGEKNNG